MSASGRDNRSSRSVGSDSPSTRDKGKSDLSEGVEEITTGVGQISNGVIKGVGKTLSGLAAVGIALWILLRDRDEESQTTREERYERHQQRTKTIQSRFDENEVTEDDVEDAIRWARSE